jgi:hypothetical protein
VNRKIEIWRKWKNDDKIEDKNGNMPEVKKAK